MRIAILSPVWFAVPPSGYGGIEWIVSLLADGLADAGHDVTLFASGDSHTKAHLSYVFEHAPSEQIGKSLPDAAPRPRLFRSGRRIRRHQRPFGAAGGRARRPRRDPGSAHGARASRGRTRIRLRRAQPARPGRRPDLDLAQSAQPDAGAQLGGQLSERARPPALPVQAAHRRLPALPRPDEP